MDYLYSTRRSWDRLNGKHCMGKTTALYWDCPVSCQWIMIQNIKFIYESKEFFTRIPCVSGLSWPDKTGNCWNSSDFLVWFKKKIHSAVSTFILDYFSCSCGYCYITMASILTCSRFRSIFCTCMVICIQYLAFHSYNTVTRRFIGVLLKRSTNAYGHPYLICRIWFVNMS